MCNIAPMMHAYVLHVLEYIHWIHLAAIYIKNRTHSASLDRER